MNILLSYPRSGNHWVRFMIEFLSKRPSLGCKGNSADKPIYKNIFPTDNPLIIENYQPIIEKVHFHNNIEIENANKLILIVRNYNDVKITYHGKNFDLNNIKNYFDNIKFFDEYKKDKLIIFYYDLLFNPSKIADKIYNFLELKDNNRLRQFKDNIEYYSDLSKKGKNRSWVGAISGKDTKFYRKKLIKI